MSIYIFKHTQKNIEFKFLGRILIAFLCLVSLVSAQDKKDTLHDFSLVLSGGGSRGLSQIGVIKALIEADLYPSLIVGNSMGALVGAFFASGLSVDSMIEISKKISWNDFYLNTVSRNNLFVSRKNEAVFSQYSFRFKKDLTPVFPRSISNGQSFFDELAPILSPVMYQSGFEFDNLKIPLRIIATDLVSGEKVVFKDGNIVIALRASCSVPFMFSPLNSGNRLLIDGGFSENLPIATAREMSVNPIVAVNVTSPLWGKNDLDNPINFGDQLIGIALHKKTIEIKNRADVLIEPDLSGFKNTDFSTIDSLIQRGYVAGRLAVLKIRAATGACIQSDSGIKKFSVKRDVPVLALPQGTQNEKKLLDSLFTAYAVQNDSIGFEQCVDSVFVQWTQRAHKTFLKVKNCKFFHDTLQVTISQSTVAGFQISGNAITKTELIKNAIPARVGDPITSELVGSIIRVMYAMELFDNVNVDVDPGNIIRIMVVEKLYLGARMSLRYDEFHLGEGYVAPFYDNLLGYGINASMHLQYGLRREKYAFELSGNHNLFGLINGFAKAATYVSREHIREVIDTASNDTSISTQFFLQEQTLRKAGLLAAFGFEFGTISQIEVGLRLEQFKVHQSDRNIFSDPLSSFKNGIRYLFVRLTLDNLDQFPYPRNGRRHTLMLGGAHDNLGGTERFLKFHGSFSRFQSFGEKNCVSGRLITAWASQRLPDVERIFMGGCIPLEKYQDLAVYNYVSFMGMQPRALPGDELIIGELAYSYLPLKDMTLSLILNWGKVWEFSEFSFNSAIINDIMKTGSVGVGAIIGYKTPIGPIRAGYGRLIGNTQYTTSKGITDNNVFYFSAGYDF